MKKLVEFFIDLRIWLEFMLLIAGVASWVWAHFQGEPWQLPLVFLGAAVVVLSIHGLSAWHSRGKEVPDWAGRLDRRFQGTERKTICNQDGSSHEKFIDGARILTHYSQEPTIQTLGEYRFSKEQREFALKQQTKINDPHAVLEETDWKSRPAQVKVRFLDYKGVLALQRFPDRVDGTIPLISSNGLVLCRETNELVLHWRSPKSRTYPACLHTVGGAYKPPGITDVDDGDKLSNTAIREIAEEIGAHFSLDSPQRIIALEEPKTGFIQLAFLGINIPKSQAERLRNNWEGGTRLVAFSELRTELC